MMNFWPNDVTHAKIDLDIGFTKASKRGAIMNQYGPIFYHYVLGNPFRFDLLKLWKPDYVLWVEIRGPLQALPHRDHGTACALNLYMESAEATTHFWEPLPIAKPVKYAPHEATANIYNAEELRHTGSFKANDDDTWLINVSKIHSVTKDPEKVRKFIQLGWRRRKFESVLNMIQADPAVLAPKAARVR